MALAATTVWEVRTTGNDANGGGFDSASGGVDRTQQDTPHATITGTVHSTTTIINVVGHTVHADDIGNTYNNASGTSLLGFYRITAVDTVNNRWTVDRSAGTAGQTHAGNMGGAKASLGSLSSLLLGGNIVWIKSGTYTITTATAGDAGPFVPGSVAVLIEGYQTTRGDLGAAPVISAGSIGSITIISAGASGTQTFRNLVADGNNQATVTGFNITSRASAHLCEARNCTVRGFDNGGMVIECLANNNAVGFLGDCYKCVSHDNTSHGFSVVTTFVVGCISHSNGGDGFNYSTAGRCAQCTAYGNAGDGFDMTISAGSYASNCVSVGNTGYGFNIGAAPNFAARGFTCAAYSNTAGNFNGGTGRLFFDQITLTGDPFTNAAGDDFSLNDTAGAGAALRAAGLGVFGQTDLTDVGATQHADPAPSSGGGFYSNAM